MNIGQTLLFNGDAGSTAASGLQSLAASGQQGAQGAVNGAASGYAGSLFQRLIIQMLTAKGQAAQTADETGGGAQDMEDTAGSLLAGMLLTEGNLSGISLPHTGTVAGETDGQGQSDGSNPTAVNGIAEMLAALNGGQPDGMQALIMAMTGAVPVLNGSSAAFGSQGKPAAEIAAVSAEAAAAGGNNAGIPASLKSLFAGGVQAAVPVETGALQEGTGARQTAFGDGVLQAFTGSGSDGKATATAGGQTALNGGKSEVPVQTSVDPALMANPSQAEPNAKIQAAILGPESGLSESGNGKQTAGTGNKTPETAAAKSDTTDETASADTSRIAQGYQNLNSAAQAADPTGQNPGVPSAEPAEPYSQIRDEILAKLEQKGPTEFKMQLEPAELGQIDINLKLSEGKLIIDILAANNKTHALLASQVDKLIAGMGLQNVQVESVQVSQQMNSQSQDSSQSQGYQMNSGMDFSQGRQQEQFQNELFKNGAMTGTAGFPQQEARGDGPADRIEAFRYGSHRMDYTV